MVGSAVLSRTFLGVVTLFAGLQSTIAADRFFVGLDGNWQGKGFIRDQPNSPQESIRCRLKTGLTPAGNRLTVLGNCSIAGFILPVSGSIFANGKRYSADLFANLVQVTNNNFSGSVRGKSLHLNYSGMDLYTRRKVKATMTISKRGSKSFDIALKRHDPDRSGSFDVGTIRFQSRD